MSLYNIITKQTTNAYRYLYQDRGYRHYLNYAFYLTVSNLPKLSY